MRPDRLAALPLDPVLASMLVLLSRAFCAGFGVKKGRPTLPVTFLSKKKWSARR